MAIDKILVPQRDFSGGQINAELKRRDDLDLVRSGGRQARNMRPVPGPAKNRPGRSAIHVSPGYRGDYVRMTPTARFKLFFSDGSITIFDEEGTEVASNSSADYLWGDDDTNIISWTQAGFDIVVCYPEMRPQIARYNRATDAWSFTAFAFRDTSETSREPFYRSRNLGATMRASARTGTITLTCSEPYFDSSMIGSIISWLGQQVEITAVSSTTVATGDVRDTLPAIMSWGISPAGTEGFSNGDIVAGTLYGRKIDLIDKTSASLVGILMDSVNFYGLTTFTADAETCVGPRAQATATGSGDNSSSWASYVVATVQWQEQFMGDVRGWPSRCSFAQNRLVFYDFPQAPEAILFGAIGQTDVFWVDATAVVNSQQAGASPSAAILEFVPSRKGKPRVLHVVDVGDLLVFTDKGTWQIPVSTSNPLKPGSLQFIDINSDAASLIPPISSQDLVFYVNAGLNRLSVIRATGAASRSFTSDDLSAAYSDIIRDPVAMALETGDDKHPERLIYLVNSDGTVAVGHEVVIGEKRGFGFFLWDGAATTRWVTVGDREVFFVDEIGGEYIVSQQDDDQYLDAAVTYNSIPTAMDPPGAMGPLWWLADQTVTLMSGLRDLGDREVDSNGDLVQETDDDLTDADLVVGLKWTFVFEPFVPNSQAGQSRKQRQRMRRVPSMVVSVMDSTGFECQGREIAPYEFDEDTTIDPPLREGTYRFTSLGRAYDPRLPITKSRPGSLTIVEVSVEATV